MKLKTLILVGLAAATTLAGAAFLASDVEANVTNKQRISCQHAFSDYTLGNNVCDKILDSGVYDVTYTVSEEDSNAITVAITYKGWDGNAIDEQKGLYCWLTDAASGTGAAALTATAPTSATTYGTNGVIQLTDAATYTKFWVFSNTSSGLASVKVTQTAAIAAQYIACLRDDGDVDVSGAVDFN